MDEKYKNKGKPYRDGSKYGNRQSYHKSDGSRSKQNTYGEALKREERYERSIQSKFGAGYIEFIFNVSVETYGEYIERVQKFSAYIAQGVSASQLRNVFSAVKSMPQNDMASLYRLRPMLAFAAGKAGNNEKLSTVTYLLDRLISEINNDATRLTAFKNFFEALLAYHKYYGGDD